MHLNAEARTSFQASSTKINKGVEKKSENTITHDKDDKQQIENI